MTPATRRPHGELRDRGGGELRDAEPASPGEFRDRSQFYRAVGDIALWQGLGAFLERLDEAAVPHRVG